jgi:hypothetical protein
MHGRSANRAAMGLAVLLLGGALGCGDARPQTPPGGPAPPPDAGDLFDPASAGTITGRVCWAGEVLSVAPLVAGPEKTAWPNPNAPVIDAKTRGVKDTVVFLRGVDLRRSRPWDHPPVRVVQRGQQLHVLQGEDDSALGFVRQGDAVELVSADSVFHSLHASGAAFFTLAFPDASDRPRTRRLSERGVVELTSAAGYFWMRGYLFVDDHPYYARTDAEGHFTLTGVPPGRYEVICWLPDWREERHERDPETSLVTRVFFRPPLESVRAVELGTKERRAVQFELSAP